MTLSKADRRAYQRRPKISCSFWDNHHFRARLEEQPAEVQAERESRLRRLQELAEQSKPLFQE